MSLMGIKYFVTFNSIEPAYSYLPVEWDKNSTRLMLSQKDVKLLYSSANYSIFENLLNVRVASGASSFTIFSNDYTAILDSARIGVNISNTVPVSLGDINSSNFGLFFNNTSSMIFLNSSDGLQTLAIDRFSNSTNSINLQEYINSLAYNPDQGWISSYDIVPILNFSLINEAVISQATPFIVTTGNNETFSVNLKGIPIGNYSLWAYVLKSQTPNSELKISNRNLSTIIDTYVPGEGLGNFTWVRIPIEINSSDITFKITSISGENGIERLVLLKSGMVKPEIKHLQYLVKTKGISVVNLSQVCAPNNGFIMTNSTINDTIREINSIQSERYPLIVVNNPNGYDLYGEFKNISVVHYGYFPGMTEESKGFQIIPTMGGLNFVLVSSGKHYEAIFIFETFNRLLIGTIILLSTVVGFISFYIISNFRPKKN